MEIVTLTVWRVVSSQLPAHTKAYRTTVSSNQSQHSRLSVRGRKHPRNDTDDETDDESSLAKKQRLARVRTTSLKTVKTPNSARSESSLPTPDVTGGEEVDGGSEVDQIIVGDEGDLDEDELEAQMLAEFAKGDFSEQGGNEDEDLVSDGDYGGG
jgi:RNA polymerase II subunit A C-terminal domain phosphatase